MIKVEAKLPFIMSKYGWRQNKQGLSLPLHIASVIITVVLTGIEPLRLSSSLTTQSTLASL